MKKNLSLAGVNVRGFELFTAKCVIFDNYIFYFAHSFSPTSTEEVLGIDVTHDET